MRRIATPQGPFSFRLHFETGEMEAICADALARSGFLPESPAPVKIDGFVGTHFRCVVDYLDLGEGLLGCMEFNADAAYGA